MKYGTFNLLLFWVTHRVWPPRLMDDHGLWSDCNNRLATKTAQTNDFVGYQIKTIPNCNTRQNNSNFIYKCLHKRLKQINFISIVAVLLSITFEKETLLFQPFGNNNNNSYYYCVVHLNSFKLSVRLLTLFSIYYEYENTFNYKLKAYSKQHFSIKRLLTSSWTAAILHFHSIDPQIRIFQ